MATNDLGAYIFVSYPRTNGIQFDSDYYLNTHLTIVEKHWRSLGLRSCAVVHFAEGDPSGLHTQAILHFDSVEAFEKAIEANIPEVMSDIKNFSNVMPITHYGKVMSQR